jgi:hypothetical protein
MGQNKSGLKRRCDANQERAVEREHIQQNSRQRYASQNDHPYVGARVEIQRESNAPTETPREICESPEPTPQPPMLG